MDGTKIEWTDATFNIAWGCAKISAGCKNCYADSLSHRYGINVWGLGAPRRTFGAKHWNEPRRWNARAEKEGRRKRVFCSSMCDVFEDHPTIDAERDKLWSLIRETPCLDWQILTKRPDRFAVGLPLDWGDGYPNVWLGISAEDQETVDERIPLLLQTPAAIRFVSYEPALAAVDFGLPIAIGKDHGSRWIRLPKAVRADFPFSGRAEEGVYRAESNPFGALSVRMRGFQPKGLLDVAGDLLGVKPGEFSRLPAPDWLIVGGESGPGARPFDVPWARSVVQQCKAANVPCFVKQLGSEPREYAEIAGALAHLQLRDRKGGDISEWPADLMVREFPEARS